ncbi:adenosylcobinamide-phosphate synthase CbiB [Acaryochloris thomasi]|uniref:adenosylcobinamide-phosphate synthase CbiB n=1 Tax=Acaryochloris thomasi TaxID=2929456 RepID=UPI00351CDB86
MNLLRSTAAVLIFAATLDYLLGDPWGWPHPVQSMGWIIQRYTQTALRSFIRPWQLRAAGMWLGLILIGGTGFLSWWFLVWVQTWSWALGLLLEIVLLASCFAGRSLRHAAEDVLAPLADDDLLEARSHLRNYVGRDTDQLSREDILRAVLETVTENATDGVMAPLFYAILGSFIPGVGPVPLALAYKAASTLDSMVGYREAPYTHLGWFSARLEDGLTWIPCRLAVLTLGILSGKLLRVLQLCRRDASKDPSPNAGWSECAYAAVLDVRLGGANWYRGVLKKKPFLGDPLQPITSVQINLALRLMRNSFLLWLSLALILDLIV